MPTNDPLNFTTSDVQEKAAKDTVALLDVNEVAKMLNCSPRHVYRLADAGKMPRPVKLGALVRWSRAAIEAWITANCPPCRRTRYYRNKG